VSHQLLMRVKELEQRLMVLEAKGPVVQVVAVGDSENLEKQFKELRDRQIKLEMQYRALNARVSKKNQEGDPMNGPK